MKKYWNPANKDVFYLHVCEYNNDYYLKVDVERLRVFKLCYKPTRIYGKAYQIGIFEIKWATFLNLHWDMRPENINKKKQLEERDGYPRRKVKHTTPTQWINRVVEVLQQVTGEEIIKRVDKEI